MYGGSLTALLMAMGIAAPSFAATADATADATSTSDSTASSSATAVGEVIVTGTRQTGVTAENSAAPIQVVGAGALKRVGQPDLIQSLAQNLPSFNAEAEGGDTANLTLTAALRGLNPNDTLVLVDGKRLHPTSNLHVDGSPYQGAATADLSFIPVAAIDHVEVLQDGAAAQYGSDAIAGVVNIILKTNTSGTILSGTGGSYYEGDGLTGALSFNQGVDLGGKGFFNLTGEWRYHDFSQQAGIDRRVQNPNQPTGITDLDVGYQVTPTIKLEMGANNLFDQRPPNVPPTPGGTRPANGSNVYNAPIGFSPWGINGGYYYGKVTLSF
jgi:iron complex outermembrane receptor protein